METAPLDHRHTPTSDWKSALPPPSSTSSPSAAFAGPNDATDPPRGTVAASLAQVTPADLFDDGQDDVAAAGVAGAAAMVEVAALPARTDRSPPPPRSPVPSPIADDVSLRVDTGALYENSLRGRRSRIGSRSKSKSSNDWADHRAVRAKHAMGGGGGGVGVGGRGGDAASSGGSLWMQAAAAVEKSTASGSFGQSLGKSGKGSGKLSRGLDSLSAGGGGGGTVASTGYGPAGRVSPGGVGSFQSGSAGGRRRPRKGSASSTDDGDSVSSSLISEGAEGDLRGSQHKQQQHRWGGEASVMVAAAEEVAALNAAKDHPDAKRAEDRMLAARAKVNHALTTLERQLALLVTRQAPTPSPIKTTRMAETRARRGFSSAYPSPRGPRSPCAPRLGEEQQPQRWVAVAPTGAAATTAPLTAAAALLMERAWSFRQDLLVTVDDLRERSVALAVAEATGAAGATDGGVAVASAAVSGAAVADAAVSSAAVAGAAAGSAPVAGRGWVPTQGSQSPPPRSATRRPPPSDRQVSSVVADEAHRVLRGEVAESTIGGVAGSLALHRAADTEREKPKGTTAAPAGGLSGVSCCLDFDRILGDDSVLAKSPEGLPGQSEGVFGGSPSPVADSMDRLGPVLDRGFVVDRPLKGFAIQSGGGGSAGGLPARERRHSDPSRVGTLAPDSWPLVLRDVSAAEEHCQEYVSAWESAGGALEKACEDLGGDDVRGLTGFFAPQ